MITRRELIRDAALAGAAAALAPVSTALASEPPPETKRIRLMTEPEKTARFLVQRGFTPNYDYALQALKELPYARWRDFNTEDSVRFFSLRLQESSPKTIIAKGTDWRFLNELKKELKA